MITIESLVDMGANVKLEVTPTKQKEVCSFIGNIGNNYCD